MTCLIDLSASCTIQNVNAESSGCKTSTDMQRVHSTQPESGAPRASLAYRPSAFYAYGPLHARLHACDPTPARTLPRSSRPTVKLSAWRHGHGVVSSFFRPQQKRIGCTRVRTWAPLGNRYQVRLPSDFKSVVLDHSTIQPKMTNRQFCTKYTLGLPLLK